MRKLRLPPTVVLIGVASMPASLVVLGSATAVGAAWSVADDAIHLMKRMMS